MRLTQFGSDFVERQLEALEAEFDDPLATATRSFHFDGDSALKRIAHAFPSRQRAPSRSLSANAISIIPPKQRCSAKHIHGRPSPWPALSVCELARRAAGARKFPEFHTGRQLISRVFAGRDYSAVLLASGALRLLGDAPRALARLHRRTPRAAFQPTIRSETHQVQPRVRRPPRGPPPRPGRRARAASHARWPRRLSLRRRPRTWASWALPRPRRDPLSSASPAGVPSAARLLRAQGSARVTGPPAARV